MKGLNAIHIIQLLSQAKPLKFPLPQATTQISQVIHKKRVSTKIKFVKTDISLLYFINPSPITSLNKEFLHLTDNALPQILPIFVS